MTKSIVRKKINQRKSTLSLFGQGASQLQIIITILVIFVGVYFTTENINQHIMKSTNGVSVSLGAFWIHLLTTTASWLFGWLMAFVLLQIIFPVIATFLNPKEKPEHDFITKLYNKCSDFQQISVTLLVLFGLVFSWVLLFMHSPVTNAG